MEASAAADPAHSTTRLAVLASGVDPNNAAVNLGMLCGSVTGAMASVGALPGSNGALNFGVSSSGDMVGSSMLNQGSGSSFIWSAAAGMLPIALQSLLAPGR
jgi:hypothetical protein